MGACLPAKSENRSNNLLLESRPPILLQTEIGRTRNVSSERVGRNKRSDAAAASQFLLEWTNNIFPQFSLPFSLLTFLLGHHKSTHNIRVDPHLASLPQIQKSSSRCPLALFFKALDPMTVVAATLHV